MKLLKRKKLGRKLLSFLLTLAILVGLMPGMGLTAYAASTTVTLYANDISGSGFVESFTKDIITITGTLDCAAKNISGPGEFTTASGKFTKIEVTANSVVIKGTGWSGGTWTGDASSNVSYDGSIMDSRSGKLKIVFTIETADATHSVTITPGSNMTKTAGSGAESQTGLSGDMTPVVYTANDGYYFPEDYAVTAVNGISVTRNSYTQITVSGTPTADAKITLTAPTAKTTPAAPTTAAAVDCTTTDNNDGKLTGVTTVMEYKKSDATDWIAGTGSDITGLVPGTYYVRLKATNTTNASAYQELTIAEYTAPTYTVTYKVVNGTWSDDTMTDKTETVQSGSKPASVPTGMKAASGYTGGSWDKNPANTTITEATTFTYTFTEKQKVATPAFSPAAGTYTEAQSVTISCETTGATIYYTTDGSEPTSSSTAYSGAITVGETMTIKAIAVKEGMTDSSVASTTYTISEGPEPSEETKVKVEDHLSDDSISDDLKNSDFNTVSKIEDALETALSITTEEEKERSKLVDVKLMISTDGGKNWTAATAENFPAGGIDVVLPYPDGTNGDEYSFSVAHMIGTSANGKTAGEIEKPGTTNTSSGISTHFNGLSPVMITWTKNSSPSKKDDSKSKEKAHTHHYVWETIEATEDSDGELRYKCDICGDIQTRVPITAYYVFNKNTTDKIRKAGQGATVKIETSRFISFHKMVMDALAERPDVTLEISFLDGEYKGNRVTVTIPAGTDALSLLDENGFVGFLYLASKYGYTLEN